MKLLRLGIKGKEKPAIIDNDGNYRDLSTIISDFSPDTLNFETIEKIKNTNVSDLPKLEYLTIMDYIILVSYVFATIPNFLTIITFSLLKKNKNLALKFENYGKKFGLPSYLLIIFIIVVINTNSSPENTNSMLSWMLPQ